MADLEAFRKDWVRPFFFYGNNRLSLIGGALTSASALVLIGFWIVDVLGHGGSANPYSRDYSRAIFARPLYPGALSNTSGHLAEAKAS